MFFKLPLTYTEAHTDVADYESMTMTLSGDVNEHCTPTMKIVNGFKAVMKKKKKTFLCHC